jgi:hypothetical protein
MVKVSHPQLQEWADAHVPKETLLFRDGYWEQIIFVRDTISRVLSDSHDTWIDIKEGWVVINTHFTKSVELPVYQLKLKNGIVITMRENFYDWKVSIHSPRDIKMNIMGLFNPKNKIEATNCDGFPESQVYGPYAKNKRKFTFEITNNNKLYTFFWIFSHTVLGITEPGRG